MAKPISLLLGLSYINPEFLDVSKLGKERSATKVWAHGHRQSLPSSGALSMFSLSIFTVLSFHFQL